MAGPLDCPAHEARITQWAERQPHRVLTIAGICGNRLVLMARLIGIAVNRLALFLESG
jgi:hypothetical protein